MVFVTLLFSFLLSLSASEAFAQNLCVRTPGYWQQHAAEWPADRIVLGRADFAPHTYSQAEMLAFLGMPARGDASLILATQLIAAKLNVFAGANPAPASAALARGDILLGAFASRLPYGTRSNTPVGADMVATAAILAAYNRGELAGSCGTANQPPVAEAGSGQSVAVDSLVTLDGSGSSDADGDPLTYSWSFVLMPEGSTASLSAAGSVMPNFVADQPGTYRVQLIVNDGQADSGPDVVEISTLNSQPTADAGAAQSVPVGTTVYLNGSGSSDPDGDLLTFAWSFVAFPGAAPPVLANATSATPSFDVDVPGEYSIRLIVTDVHGLASDPDIVTVSTVNSPPVADAGDDTTGFVGDTITLDGTDSTDVDGDPLTFLWSLSSRPEGSTAALSDPTSVTPTFTVDVFGTYVAQLVVHDGTVTSAPASVVVTTINSRPVANAGPDREATTGDTVTLDASASTDIDGNPLTYSWALIGVPDGSSALLSDASAVQPTFTADLPGLYVAQLVVRDGALDSAPDTVSITTVPPPNRAPVANAGPDQSVELGSTVQLDGGGSSDPDGDGVTYRWSLTRPTGSAAALSATDIATPAFVADVPGTYVAQLIVNDGQLESVPDTVTISTLNSVPVANAGPDQAVATASTVQLDGSASFDADGTVLQYAWSLLSVPTGSTATLSTTTIVNPTFVADREGTYVAQLVVGDGVHVSEPDTVAITVQPGADLQLSFFGIPANPPVGSTFNVGLDVRNNGPATASDVAVLFQPPAGYTVTNAVVHFTGQYDQSSGTWSGALASGGLGRIFLTLRVNATGPYDLSASVTHSSVPDPNLANNALTAEVTPNANADLRLFFCTAPPGGTFAVGASVTWCLEIRNDGPASTTGVIAQHLVPPGWTITNTVVHFAGTYDPASGAWSVPAMANAGLSRIFITARVNATGATALQAAITGSDQPDPDPADNLATNPPINRPPVAHAGPDQTSASTHATVTLDGSLTSDPEGDPLTLQWTFTLRPVNSTAALANANSAAPSFVPDHGGTYVVNLTVTDSSGASSSDTVNIAAAVLNSEPVIRSTPNTSAAVGQPYQYRVRADDPDADTLAFALPVAPAGMTIDPATGVVTWVPSESDAGPQNVTIRVQDSGGLFVLQSFAVQVSSSSNGSPIAADDLYEVRVDESLGISTPGVLQNDADETPLTARLLTGPANGTLLFNTDGSFVYTPHTQQPGELVQLEDVNLANRMPGVTVNASGFSFHGSPCGRPECAVDENPATSWSSHMQSQPFLEVQFPQDATVSRVEILGHRNPFLIDLKVTAGVLQVFAADGSELYNSGNVELTPPSRDATFMLNDIAGARRVRFSPTAGDGNSVLSRGFAEFRVIGSALIRREWVPEPNVAQLLAATVQACSITQPNLPEGLIDDTSANWYAATGGAGEFVQITLPQDATVTRIESANPSGRPDGFGTSLSINCSGSFTLLDVDGNVLFDSGIVNTPTGGLSSTIAFSLDTGEVTGVRRLRYTTTGCTGFPLGFSEIRLFGTADVAAPAFAVAKKFQSLFGREIHSTPIVVNLTDDNFDGVIDANDTPDIVVPVEGEATQLRGEIKAISGADGTLLFTAGSPDLVSPWSELAAGDLDGDGLPEIVAVHGDRNHLIAFDHAGGVKWTSDAHAMPQFALGSGVGVGAVAIANLDGDGPPEVIIGASVFDFQGRLLGDGRTLGGTTGGTGLRSAIPAIADVDLNGVAELVAGPTAYRLAGGLARVWQRTDRADGFVGIANLDDDPHAEIVIVANGTVYALNHDGSDAEVWNPPSHGPVPLPGGGQGGAPLIVDVDGDGRPEIGVAGAVNYVLFNRDGSIRWQSAVRDRSSNSTGSVAFDLDGDGRVEIIYRDEFFLRIYRGSDGLLLSKVPIGSSTWAEVPVVADVDNDGRADIVVSSDLLEQPAGALDTGIIVLQDAANKWTRTRRIWNQHAYHVTNVNEDASIPLVETPHWLVPGLNGFRTNAFPARATADRGDSFTYVAEDGVLHSNVATVHITVRTPNAPPEITSVAVTSAAHDVLYSYAAIASDPDPSDLLTFSLPTAPAGMIVDSAAGLIQWTPGANQAGAHEVVVKVQDLRGLFALQGFTVTVADPVAVPDVVGQPQAAAESAIAVATLAVGAISTRHSPTAAEGSIISQSPVGGTLAAPGSAVNLVASLGPAPAGTVPDVVGMAQPAAEADIGAAGFAVGVVTGQNHATVPAGIVLAQSPAANTIADLGSGIALLVSLGPPPGEIDLDGDGFTGNQGDCNDSDASINPGAVDSPGDGIDQNCNGTDSVAGDGTSPTAALVSPDDLAEVTMPTDIVGTVADANFLRYTVQLAEVDATTFTVIGSGTAPVTGGVVGRLDPTLLENGLYRVRLIAEDVNGQSAVDERVYRVNGAAKVGLFSLTFVDLKVPVTGIAITIERTYDSRVKTQRDFGAGWSLAVKAGRVQHNRPTGEGWLLTDNGGPFDLPCTVTSELRSHITEVRLSDREFYLFRPVLRDVAALGGGCTGTVAYESAGGTALGATLAILDGEDFLFTPGDNRLFYIDGSLNTGLLFNPRRLRLTTVDGRVVDLERGVGVTRAEDNNGNSLTIGERGIVHSSGKSVAFTRDVRSRLTRITDPRGHTLEYGYTGDDLTTFTDQAGNVTTFTYDEDHNLLTIVDPLGNRAVLTEYDADGRLIAVTDARGGRTEFTHDVAGREEIVIDALGRTSRIAYDDRGHVTLQERAVTIDGAAVTARTSFQHDAAGNETEVLDADGVRIQGTYDALNLLEEVVDPDGLALRTLRTYDARGEVLTQTDASGRSMAFAYDRRGNLTVLTDGAGSQARLSYDTGGRPTSSTDALGRTRRLAFDTSGRVLREEQLAANGAVVERVDFSYDANGNRVSRTELRSVNGVQMPVTTSSAYDAHNRLIAITDAMGGVTRIEYNAVGLESARVDPLGRRTAFSYDEVGALVRTDFPDGTFESYQYDPVGNLTSTRDRAGHTTTFEYDELKRQVRAIRPDGSAVRTIYSAAGRVLATIDARGHRTDHEYDDAGRRLRTLQPAVIDATTGTQRRPETIYETDGAGRITAIVDPNGRRTSFAYDEVGRLVRRTAADGTTREYVYDSAGQLVEQRDELGRRTVLTYDGAGRLTSVMNALSGVTSYAYDPAGLLQSQTDALGRTTQFLRDALGRATTRRLPGGAVETFSYDAMGNRLAHTDFNGATVRFTYDTMNRLTRRHYPDGLEHSFSYTPTGQRAAATDARGTTVYVYDVNDRLTRVDHPGGEAVQYAYDLDGNIRRIDSGASIVDYTRDAMDRITSVDAVLSGIPVGGVGFGYDVAGNLIEQRRPNGSVTRVEHDVRNRVTRIVHDHNGSTLGSFAYQLSPTGRRTQVSELGGGVVRYGYDALDRLVSEVRDGVYSIAYEYDAVGNRVRVTRDGTVSAYAFDVDDRLLSGGGATFTYDANGNLQTRTLGGQTTSYEWNADGQLLRTTGSGGSAQFSYDVDGHRVAREAGGATTNYLVDVMNPSGLSQVLEERDESSNVVTQYVHGSNLVAARRAAGTSFYHGDALSSTRLLTDTAGAVTDRYDYDAFGTALAAGPSANPFLFAGQQFEPVGGLYYLRARYYEPASGRFLGRDPFPGRLSDPRSMHPYVYAHADPVNVTDPTGLFSLIELSVGQNIQGILRALDFSASSVARYCSTTGKLEVAQEALFWGQFVAAGPVLANELFGQSNPNAAFEVNVAAKRFLNVFNTPEKIVEAKVSVEIARDGGRKLGAEFTRQDGFQFGGAIDFANPSKSKFKVQAGLVTFEAGSTSESSIGLKKTIPIFESKRCNIDLVKGNLEVSAKIGLGGPSVEAAFVLEALNALMKFTYPVMTLP